MKKIATVLKNGTNFGPFRLITLDSFRKKAVDGLTVDILKNEIKMELTPFGFI